MTGPDKTPARGIGRPLSMTAIQQLGSARNIRAALVCILTAAPMLAGCAELPTSAKQKLLQAEREYRDADYRAARRDLDRFLGEYPHHSESAQAYYLRALCLVQQSDKAKANEDIQHCIRLSRHTNLTAKAHAMAGALLYESGNTRSALSHYAKALKNLPEQPPTDRVRFRYGLCLQRNGEWEKAKAQFSLVFQRYPDSKCAAEARKLYDCPTNAFSIQCGAFRNKSAAGELKAKLKRLGLNGRIESRPRSGEFLHYVFVGRYSRYDQAEHALGRVRHHIKDALITP